MSDPYKDLIEAAEFLRKHDKGKPSRYFMFYGKMYDAENLSEQDKLELKPLFNSTKNEQNSSSNSML